MAIAANTSLNIVKVSKDYSKLNLVSQLLEGLVIDNLIYSHKNLLLLSFRDFPGLCFFNYKKDLLLKSIAPSFSNPFTVVALTSVTFTAPPLTRATQSRYHFVKTMSHLLLVDATSLTAEPLLAFPSEIYGNSLHFSPDGVLALRCSLDQSFTLYVID
jgi:hypothetical protein